MRVGLVTPRPAELAYSRPPEKGPRSCDEVRGALLRGSSAVISNSDLLRWSCNASDKLSKPVRGDSVLRRGGGGLRGAGGEGYAARAVGKGGGS
jgi:hypothetical protein